jgi:alkanesulfonate monooxygenase SsuD/methylene tetrahydromethanopterin reductase-like flavin-dependent oxidoreductase (luciferase family)
MEAAAALTSLWGIDAATVEEANIHRACLVGPSGLSEQQRIADAFFAEHLIPAKLDTAALKIWTSKEIAARRVVQERRVLEQICIDIAALQRLANANHTMFQGTVNLARRGNLTVRQLLRALGGGVEHRIIVGTPEQIADDIEAWFRVGAADGFNLMPDVLPSGLGTFVDTVVPILQRRGLFRKDYRGSTLRDHFGLAKPPSRFAKSVPAAASA